MAGTEEWKTVGQSSLRLLPWQQLEITVVMLLAAVLVVLEAVNY
jgi:hypothetical protein